MSVTDATDVFAFLTTGTLLGVEIGSSVHTLCSMYEPEERSRLGKRFDLFCYKNRGIQITAKNGRIVLIGVYFAVPGSQVAHLAQTLRFNLLRSLGVVGPIARDLDADHVDDLTGRAETQCGVSVYFENGLPTTAQLS